MPADVEYRADLDDSEVLKALKNIDRNLDKLANDGDKSFKKIGKSAKGMGVQIGATAGIVQELTRRFINMAEQAARAFLEIAKGGVEINKSLELLEIRATNILGGNQKAAQAFLATVQEAASQLKLDYVELAELATRVLPDADSIAGAVEVSARALQLAATQAVPEANARRAVAEALAGQFVSMEKILNVSKDQIAKIKELEKEIGRTAAISQVLGEELENAGFNVEDMATTFNSLFKVIQSEGQNLQRILGEPVFEELKEQATAFLEVFDEHRDDIERVALAFGQFLADVVKLIGTNLIEFLDSVDYQKLEDAADALSDVVAHADAFIKIISGGDINDTLGLMVNLAERLSDAFRTAAQGAAIIRAEMARRQAIEESLTERGQGFDILLTQATEEDRAKGQQAHSESIQETVDIFKELDERIEENEKRTNARTEAVEEGIDADIAAGDEYLRLTNLLEELTAAEKEEAEAKDKIREAQEKLATEAGRRLIEIEKDTQREILEDAIDAAQKREDLARENADKIEDIHRKHQQEIADAARDLTRDEEDIYRNYARDRAEADRDSANERLDIEREYRRELQRILGRFNESAAEAERNNDAQAFLEAVRQKDREINEAKRGRAEGLEDASIRAAEQRENLKQQLEYEIEDAHIANQRKLEDLQIRLERELEAQRLAYERDQEEQRINEERKAEERMRAYTQEIIDHHNKEKQKRDDLAKSLTEEFELVKHAADLKREYEVESAKQTVAEINAARASLSYGTSYGTDRGEPIFMQEGGDVRAGQPYIVGERGPELFIPAMSGQIVPTPSLPAAQAVSNVSTTVSPTFNVAESLFNDPVAVRKLQNLMLGVLTEAL